MDAVAEDGLSVIISSHIVADLERFCDHLVILSASHVQIADMESLVISQNRYADLDCAVHFWYPLWSFFLVEFLYSYCDARDPYY